jgi:hypothetical protein
MLHTLLPLQLHLALDLPVYPLDPKGSWLCPGCCAGKAPARLHNHANSSETAREKFLAPKAELEMVRIEAIWKLPDGTVEFVGRWYIKPEATLTGRQVTLTSLSFFLLLVSLATTGWPLLGAWN